MFLIKTCTHWTSEQLTVRLTEATLNKVRPKESGQSDVIYYGRITCRMRCFWVGIVILKTQNISHLWKTMLTHIFLKCLPIRKKTTATPKKVTKKKQVGRCYHVSPLCQRWHRDGPDWSTGRSILPQRRRVDRRAVGHQRPALVSPQVLAVGTLDGDSSVFHKLKEKVLRLFSVRTHQAATRDVPEPPTCTCSGMHLLTVSTFKVRLYWTVRTKLTLYVVGAVVEDQREDVVDRPIGVQSVGVLVVADEAVLSAQDQHGPVNELHQEQFVITCRKALTLGRYADGRGTIRVIRSIGAPTDCVADGWKLTVLFCTQVLPVAGFEGHPLTPPLDLKLCVDLPEEKNRWLMFDWY